MASIISLLRRIGGAKASPATGSAGQLALWKAGAKPTDALSLFAHDGTQWIEVIDTRGQVVSPRITTIGATAPASPAPQDMWLNSATNLLSIWDGATWCTTDTHQASTSVIAPVAPQTGAMWLDPGKKELQVWDGSQWANVAFKNVTNTFIKPQIIDVNDASAALHIKQLGTGDALRIEDEANPDATPFVVDASGNVGVGISAPGYKVHVNGASINQDGAVIMMNSPVAAANAGLAGTRSNSDYVICTNSKEAARFAADGKVGVGLVTPEVPEATLHVSGVGGWSSNNYSKSLLITSKVANPAIAISDFAGGNLWAIANTSGALVFSKMSFLSDNTAPPIENLKLDTNGQMWSLPTYTQTGAGSAVNVASNGAIFRASSSLKYKKDIEALDPVLTDRAVAGLRPIWYRSKDPRGDDKAEWSHIGLIAEEVAAVEPRLVKFKTMEMGTDDEGKPVETVLETPVAEDVDYARLSVLLLAKVQQLETRLAKLEARP